MAKTNGQLVTCDRCGKQVFVKCVGEGEADGGFTRWNKFESLPDGWGLVAVPSSLGWVGCGNAYNGYLEVCPDCHELWDTLIIENFVKGTPYYPEVEESNESN